MSVALHNSARARHSLMALPLALSAWIAIAVFTGFACGGCRSKSADRAADSTIKPRPTEHPQVATPVQPSAAPSENPPASVPDAAGMPGKSLEAGPAAPISPAAATGDATHDWALKYERTENGPDADLVVRTGDVNNLGFGWPSGFDPFSGKSTPPHRFPWTTEPNEPQGTDRILLGSSVDPTEELRDPIAYNRRGGDGYSGILSDCALAGEQSCQARQDSLPRPITIAVGALPPKVKAILVQIFVDDFQPHHFHSSFRVSLNGTRIPNFEYAINALDQTGPIGKLVTLRILPEYWPLLQAGKVQLLIDDPTTRARDGYAIDFVRILVNPHAFRYRVSLSATVLDADTRKPLPTATVSAALESANADTLGKCELKDLPAGLVMVTAIAPGYDEDSVPVDLADGEKGHAEILLHRHEENTSALERSIAQTGTASIYGIHFDTDSPKLRSDSRPALNAVLGLVKNHPDSKWLIAGHTDDQGAAEHNQPLSGRRAAAVIVWLKDQGADASRLFPQGFGSTRPVADNATAGGRALNRRVEVALTK